MITRLLYQGNDVFADGVGDDNAGKFAAQLLQQLGAGDSFNRFVRRAVAKMSEDGYFFLLRGIAHGQAQEETIHLRGGQHKCALMLDGVLRCQHEEGIRQRIRLAVDGRLALFHGFQQRGLRARNGAVDLIGQQDVGVHRAALELKIAALLVIDHHAYDVRGQQIGRELQTAEIAAQGDGQRANQRGFAAAGQIAEQHMAAGEDGHENQVDLMLLADDDLLGFAAQAGRDACDIFHLSFPLLRLLGRRRFLYNIIK